MTRDPKPIIDLRSEKSYIQGHLMGAVHIPFEQLQNLWHELPPKGSSFDICTEPEDQSRAIKLFSQRDFIIDHCYLPQDLEQAPLEQGSNFNRVWKGNPILESHSDILQTKTDQPIAIDIGCGSGRDSILMGLLGYRVFGIDVFDGALERLQQSAHRWDLNIEAIKMDCRKHPEELVALFEEHKPQLIMQSRFLHRPLFELYENYLPTGCAIAIHTFLEGAAKFGKPKKADFLLKNDELSERFSHWSVLIDQVHYLEDGRPLSLFVAKKSALSQGNH